MKLRCDGKFVFFVVGESLCGATVNLFDCLGLKHTMSDAHSRELTVVMAER